MDTSNTYERYQSLRGMATSSTPEQSEILKLVSFDAGGVRALSQLHIMRDIMHQINWMPDETSKGLLPCEVFNLMGGSDTGGLIVIMLVKLRMSVEEATDEFVAIMKDVYAKDLTPTQTSPRTKESAKQVLERERTERTKRLKEHIWRLLKKKKKPRNLKLREPSGGCKGFVLAAACNNIAHTICLRTYSVGSQPPLDITVVDAVLSTCASQPYFLPASFEVGSRPLKYVGADLAEANPVNYVAAEANSLFGGKSVVSSLLSLGSGHPGIIAFPSGDVLDGVRQVALRMMGDCEKHAEAMRKKMGPSEGYFRFSVQQGAQLGHAERDERSWIFDQTDGYLELADTAASLKHYVRTVGNQMGLTTLDTLLSVSSIPITGPAASSVASADGIGGSISAPVANPALRIVETAD